MSVVTWWGLLKALLAMTGLPLLATAAQLMLLPGPLGTRVRS